MPLPMDPPNDIFTSLTPTMDRSRSVIAGLGLRLYRVYFVVETFETERGEGEATISFEELVPSPRVDFLSAARVANSGGAYLDGAVALTKISRTMRREQLLGLTESGDPRDKRERFTIGLVCRGQAHIDLYKPASQPVLEALAWKMVVNPVNRRMDAPGLV